MSEYTADEEEMMRKVSAASSNMFREWEDVSSVGPVVRPDYVEYFENILNLSETLEEFLYKPDEIGSIDKLDIFIALTKSFEQIYDLESKGSKNAHALSVALDKTNQLFDDTFPNFADLSDYGSKRILPNLIYLLLFDCVLSLNYGIKTDVYKGYITIVQKDYVITKKELLNIINTHIENCGKGTTSRKQSVSKRQSVKSTKRNSTKSVQRQSVQRRSVQRRSVQRRVPVQSQDAITPLQTHTPDGIPIPSIPKDQIRGTDLSIPEWVYESNLYKFINDIGYRKAITYYPIHLIDTYAGYASFRKGRDIALEMEPIKTSDGAIVRSAIYNIAKRLKKIKITNDMSPNKKNLVQIYNRIIQFQTNMKQNFQYTSFNTFNGPILEILVDMIDNNTPVGNQDIELLKGMIEDCDAYYKQHFSDKGIRFRNNMMFRNHPMSGIVLELINYRNQIVDALKTINSSGFGFTYYY